ncbi:LuxR C-terminal-related transcriptional regulator [Pseudomonas sp. HR96]|uniref:LuxR C-terminal-related transcriptional regulator n=1 Tax=Pseudomonas sp. HR96 TaxID=1027966 RepID=UPI002A74BFA9|nr:LuxR C-terminal-related transcriptional regulator [Pseudomonas sp. HR96]WPP01233.1 LuxR C-terminal-related transcriptional regulator [Pseudomonas sp. HR96]
MLSLTASGKTAAQVGQVLYLSERTVNFHVANAVAKLAAANKTEAVAIAVRSGWI